MAVPFISNYIYAVFRRLRLISLICFLSLTSNLVGNFVWTYVDHKESINLSSEEDENNEEEPDSDTDENRGSSKRGINLLEEELHLAEHTALYGLSADLTLIQKSNFSVITDKTNGSKKAPLDNPPEVV